MAVALRWYSSRLVPRHQCGDDLGDRVTLHVDLHGDDDVVVDGYATFRRHLPDLS